MLVVNNGFVVFYFNIIMLDIICLWYIFFYVKIVIIIKNWLKEIILS